MAIPRNIVIGPTCVFNAEDSTIQQIVKRSQIPLQNVVYMEKRIPQVTRAVTIIIT
jgi:hypothetical protein